MACTSLCYTGCSRQSPRGTLEFVPSQEFEVKHFLYLLGFKNKDQVAFFKRVRRMSFSVVASSNYGRRIVSAEDPMSNAGKISALLG